MDIFDSYRKHAAKLDNEIPDLENKIAQGPPGRLKTETHNNRIKLYIYSGENSNWKRKYVSQKEYNSELMSRYAIKSWNEARLFDARAERKALLALFDTLKKCYHTNDEIYASRVQKLLETNPHIRTFMKTKDELEWASAEYEHYEEYPEKLVHSSRGGLKCRSKTEAMIASLLEECNYSFRYEETIIVNGIRFHPDFSIYDPSTGEIIYWEHFGLIENEQYRLHMLKKLNEYCKAGIYPMINLITTFETKNHPFTYRDALAVIDHFLGTRK